VCIIYFRSVLKDIINMLSKAWGIAAGAASLAFVGYCIYFDYKRRSDPLFKQKLRES
jgi:import receptor subunit TOM20